MPYTRSERAVLRRFGERVREARDRRGWSQERLAAEAGLDRTYVGSVERGERNVALLNINKLALALNDDFAGILPSPTDGRRKPAGGVSRSRRARNGPSGRNRP